jgi:hypothetical protein
LAFANNVEQGFWIVDTQKTWLKTLSAHKDLVIDHPTSQGFELYGPQGTEQYLDSLGVLYLNLNNNKDLLATYPTSQQVSQEIAALARRVPQFMSVFSIGKSHQGKELWVVKISDNVAQDEIEPEIKFIANMHGDEIVGRELMVFLLRDLVKGIETNDARILELVKHHEIFIMPSMNPDGADLRQRGNGRSVDLNRNFPDFTTRDNRNEPGTREPETRAVMAWQAQRRFILSANFHGGAVVVNYPWDTTPDVHPQDEHIVELSKDYANIVPEMSSSTEFPGGIVNGYRWYEVNGGMQDWSYYWYGDLQFTMEVSDPKWPNYSEVPAYYQAHKEALIGFLEKGKLGLGLQSATTIPRSPLIIRSLTRNWQMTRSMEGQEFFVSLPQDRYEIELKLAGQSKKFEATVDESGPAQYIKIQ